MSARERAEELRTQAINELLTEREAIDAQLKQLGYGEEIKTAPHKRRGRPPKNGIDSLPSNEDINSAAEPSSLPDPVFNK